MRRVRRGNRRFVPLSQGNKQSRDVRYGSKADIGEGATDVRFTPKSRHWNLVTKCPLCAKSGHYAPQQKGSLFDHLVRA